MDKQTSKERSTQGATVFGFEFVFVFVTWNRYPAHFWVYVHVFALQILIVRKEPRTQIKT